MGFLKRIKRSATTTSQTSTASSSSTDLSTSPTSDLSLTTTATTHSYTNTNELSKTPSRLRKFLSSSKKPEKEMSADEWHAAYGPPRRSKRPVDPVHRAQLEAWAMDFGCADGRKGSLLSEGKSPMSSPCCSQRGSMQLERGSGVEEVESA